MLVCIAGGLYSVACERGLLPSRGARASHCGGFSCCGARAPGRVGFSGGSAWALEHRFSSGDTGLVGSSQTKACTRDSCTSRQTLCHWATCEAFLYPFIYGWTLRLLTCLGDCKWCRCEHCMGAVHVLFSNGSFLWMYALEWDCWIIW